MNPTDPAAPSTPPIEPLQQPEVPSDHTMQTLIPTKNMPALLSYYFGVFGLIPFIGLPLAITAVILGNKGLAQYKQNPTPGAKGHAKVGIVLGYIQIVAFVLFIAFIVFV